MPAGLLLASGMVYLLSYLPEADFFSWGWRIAFLISAILVVIGMYIRLKIMEIEGQNSGRLSVSYGQLLYRDLGLACMCLQQKKEALSAFDIAQTMRERDPEVEAEIAEARRKLNAPQ